MQCSVLDTGIGIIASYSAISVAVATIVANDYYFIISKMSDSNQIG